jgi:FkbM family methyltransferase
MLKDMPMLKNDPHTLVAIEDMFIFYNSNDHAFSYALTDPRASVVSIESAVRRWNPNTASPAEAWSLKGMGIFSLAAIHMWNNGLDFSYYDVGANIGMTTIAQAIFFRRCGHPTHTIAFEPGPIHDALAKSIEINDLQDAITLYNAAASDAAGYVTFHVTPEQSPASSLLQAAVQRDGVTETRKIQVKAVRLDDVIEAQSAPNALIKIDAEGADFKVLSGLQRAMRERLTIIAIEFFPSLVETYTDPVKRLTELGQNFDLFEIAGSTASPLQANPETISRMIADTKARPMPATDLLFLPKALPNLEVLRNRLCEN